MYICYFCKETITEGFVGSKNETKIYSCFSCFMQTLKPFKFDMGFVYYPLFGIRDIQLEDSVVFYDNDGKVLAKVYLKSYEEGFLSYLKEEITLMIEPRDIQLKE